MNLSADSKAVLTVLIIIVVAMICMWIYLYQMEKRNKKGSKRETTGGMRFEVVDSCISTGLQAKVRNNFVVVFEHIGWSNWNESVHFVSGQYERMERSLLENMEVLENDFIESKATVRDWDGNIYSVSDAGCSCEDFVSRRLPCAHMYRVAMEYEDSL